MAAAADTKTATATDAKTAKKKKVKEVVYLTSERAMVFHTRENCYGAAIRISIDETEDRTHCVACQAKQDLKADDSGTDDDDDDDADAKKPHPAVSSPSNWQPPVKKQASLSMMSFNIDDTNRKKEVKDIPKLVDKLSSLIKASKAGLVTLSECSAAKTAIQLAAELGWEETHFKPNYTHLVTLWDPNRWTPLTRVAQSHYGRNQIMMFQPKDDPTREVLYCSTHLQHKGKSKKNRSLGNLVKDVVELYNKWKPTDVVVTGDFNMHGSDVANAFDAVELKVLPVLAEVTTEKGRSIDNFLVSSALWRGPGKVLSDVKSFSHFPIVFDAP